MNTYLLTGQMQGGKTTKAVKLFRGWVNEEPDTYPVAATFGRNHILQDFERKMIAGGVSRQQLFIPGQDRAGFRKIKERIFGDSLPKDVGIFGLHNYSFHDKIASTILFNNFNVKLLLDEYDTGQVGFDEEFMDYSVKQDHAIDSYIRKEVLDELWLVSATNLQGAISSLNFDGVISIKPGEGYQGMHDIEFETLYDDDIDSLMEGLPNKKIMHRIIESHGHVMFNLDRKMAIHENIASAVDSYGKTMILNSRSNFDISELDDLSTKKIVIGGDMFARGATFPNITSLFFHKPGAHMAVKLQAVGRLFGYKNKPLKLYCTKREQYQIQKMLELNERFSDTDFLKQEWQIRHEQIAKISLPDEMSIFNPNKANGFLETTRKPLIDEPEIVVKDAPQDSKVTMLQIKHEGIPPKRGKATYRWGNDPDHMKRSLINAHPFTGSPMNEKQGGPRQFIVPPTNYKDYAEYCDYECPNGHWWIENIYAKNVEALKQIKTQYVGTYRSNGEVAIWHNVWPEDAVEETVISRSVKN